MCRIRGKLNEHFAFLNADGAAPDGTKIRKKQFAYRDLVNIMNERSQVHLNSAVFVVFDYLQKLFKINRLIAINFWRLID